MLKKLDPSRRGSEFIRRRTDAGREAGSAAIRSNSDRIRRPSAGDVAYEFTPYQLDGRVVVYHGSVTGDGGLGFDSGEGA